MIFSVNSSCFLVVPNEQNQRILLPGTTQQISGNDVVIRFKETVSLQPGSDATIYAHVRGKFFQQAIKIIAMSAEQNAQAGNQIPLTGSTEAVESLVAVSLVGEAVSAENRGSFRVSIASCEYHATVANQKNCLIVDISAEGCAAICAKPLTVGTTVEMNFTIEGITVSGKLKVQTSKTLPSGKLRFGLLAAEKRSPVRSALEKLSAFMQRAQLQRISGAA